MSSGASLNQQATSLLASINAEKTNCLADLSQGVSDKMVDLVAMEIRRDGLGPVKQWLKEQTK